MNNYAFLVNCTYNRSSPWPALPDTKDDIKKINTVLVDNCGCSNDNIVILSDSQESEYQPGMTDIPLAIKTELGKQKVSFDIVFFYFSGHGIMQDGIAKIVPFDSNEKKHTISINEIITNIEETGKAKHIVLIIDCCQNEFEEKNALNLNLQVNGHVVFYSCAPYQSSYMIPSEHTAKHGRGSVFTKCIVAALSRDSNCSTVTQVAEYTTKKMNELCAEINRKQTPYTTLQNISSGNLIITEYKPMRKWGEKEAKIFANLSNCPLVPSDSELDFYGRYLDIIKNEVSNPRVLILGSTYKLYKLAIDKSITDITIVDNSNAYFNAIWKSVTTTNTTIEEAKKTGLEEQNSRNSNNVIQTNLDGQSSKSVEGHLPNVIDCDWSSMGNVLSNNSYDIILGDLAMGNVPEEHIEDTINSISNLLKDSGFWIGKDIYTYGAKYDFKHIKELFRKNQHIDTPEELFSKLLYSTVMFCSCSNNNILSFERFSVVLKNLPKDFNNSEKAKAVVKLFEQFKVLYDSGLSFRVYNPKEIASLAEKSGMFIYETGYGKDAYSDDYVLFVYKKGSMDSILEESGLRNSGNLYDKVYQFFSEEANQHDYFEQWVQKIPSEYYIVRLMKSLKMESTNMWVNNLPKIKSRVKNSINKVKINLNDDFNFEIHGTLTEGDMETELQFIPKTDKTLPQKENLISTYQLAVLLYLSIALFDNDNSNDLYEMVSRKLHSDITKSDSGLWEPASALWLTAKVCIAAANCSEARSKGLDNSSIDSKSSNALEKDSISVVDRIINRYIEAKQTWESKIGSQEDTNALCIEAILCYIDKLENTENAKKKLYTILEQHVLDGNVYNTIIRNPLGSYAVQQLPVVYNEHEPYKPEKGPYQKKILGRIAFFVALIKLIDYFTSLKNDDPYYVKVQQHISEFKTSRKIFVYKLFQFWTEFDDSKNDEPETINIHKRIDVINKRDACMIPQILYSLTVLKRDIIANDD